MAIALIGQLELFFGFGTAKYDVLVASALALATGAMQGGTHLSSVRDDGAAHLVLAAGSPETLLQASEYVALEVAEPGRV